MRRGILILTAVVLTTAMVVASFPATAQPQEMAQADQKAAAKAEKKAARQAQKAQQKQQKAALPPTGGISSGSAVLLGLGASALLLGGGLLVRRRHA